MVRWDLSEWDAGPLGQQSPPQHLLGFESMTLAMVQIIGLSAYQYAKSLR